MITWALGGRSAAGLGRLRPWVSNRGACPARARPAPASDTTTVQPDAVLVRRANRTRATLCRGPGKPRPRPTATVATGRRGCGGPRRSAIFPRPPNRADPKVAATRRCPHRRRRGASAEARRGGPRRGRRSEQGARRFPGRTRWVGRDPSARSPVRLPGQAVPMRGRSGGPAVRQRSGVRRPARDAMGRRVVRWARLPVGPTAAEPGPVRGEILAAARTVVPGAS